MSIDYNRPIFAIDTSTNYLSLALQADGKILQLHREVGAQQSELILPQIRILFEQAAISAQDLGLIVYAQGPGSFTSLRIGTGVAQGLAAPFNTNLMGIPCLDAVAYQIQAEWVLAVTDARMGEVFYAWFNTLSATRLTDYQVGKAREINLPDAEISANQVHGIGNAYALNCPPSYTGIDKMPTAVDYLDLAKSNRYPTHQADEVELLYVRNKIALTLQEQRQRKGNAC